jgi:ubiquinone/menaquinone biosynthesis C-methylase UbiE
MKQVDKNHYLFEHYCYPERWASYYHQLREVLVSSPKSILEVGGGDGVLESYIKRNIADAIYTSVDIAEDLNPDVVAAIDALPFADASFDVVCAFEVLEHIPFEKFEKALGELLRVSKKRVLISMPHFGPPFALSFKFPFLREIKLLLKLPFPKKHVFNGQHYWEIGKKGYSPRHLGAVISKLAHIKKEFVPFDSRYHHFYILEKR